MKKCFLALILLTGASMYEARAQQVVLLADTALVTGTNSIGSPVSGSTIFNTGATMDEFFPDRIADDFTVPAGEFWRIDSLITYGYEFNGGSTSPFVAGYVRIFDGVPGNGGNVIAGDVSTNRLVSSSFTGIYRVDHSTPNDFSRPIMRLGMSMPATTPAMLAAGTYWISWSTEVSTLNVARAPYKVLPGPTSPPGQNGRIFRNGTWSAAEDTSTNIFLGFNMILKGTKATSSVGNEVSKMAFKLNAPYPNPIARGSNATISFSVTNKGRVNVRVLNAVGQQVATIMEEEVAAGEYILPFSTSSLSAGVYRISLQTEGGSTAVPLTVK